MAHRRYMQLSLSFLYPFRCALRVLITSDLHRRRDVFSMSGTVKTILMPTREEHRLLKFKPVNTTLDVQKLTESIKCSY